MNLAIIGTNNSSYSKVDKLKSSKYMTKIEGEYPIERIIRIGRINGIEKVFCVIDPAEIELKHYALTNNFGIPIKLFIQDTENALHSLFVMAPFLMKEPFLIVTKDMVFNENEFSEFITYSRLQVDADGVVAITRYFNDKEPLCVAMNDEDIVLKFSDTKDGYSWAAAGIYYFLPNVFNEMESALRAGISSLSKTLQLLIVKKYVLKGFSFSRISRLESLADTEDAKNLILGN